MADSSGKTGPSAEPASKSDVLRRLFAADVAIVRRDDFIGGLIKYVGERRNLPPLARLLLRYAVKRRSSFRGGLPIHDGSEGTMRNDGASWRQVHAELDAMHKAWQVAIAKSPPPPCKLAAFGTSDNLRNFLLGISDSSNLGTQAYGLLALFTMEVIVHYRELLDDPWLAAEDRKAGKDLLAQWEWLCREAPEAASPLSPYKSAAGPGAGSTDADADTVHDAASYQHYVTRFFALPQHRQAAFNGFFESLAHGEARHAHFICYRPRRSQPTQLIKSFLAVVPPGEGGGRNQLKYNYTFAHFYKPNAEETQVRQSRGIVMPMESALYFIGGQQVPARRSEVANGFRALKIIAIPWVPVVHARSVLPGLALSITRNESLVVSRVALIGTSLTRDTDVRIESVPLDGLEDDLVRLREAQVAAGGLRGDDEDVGTLARTIADMTNNRMSLDVEGLFADANGSVATRADIEGLLRRAFLDNQNRPRFRTADGDALTWDRLRFGALDALLS